MNLIGCIALHYIVHVRVVTVGRTESKLIAHAVSGMSMNGVLP